MGHTGVVPEGVSRDDPVGMLGVIPLQVDDFQVGLSDPQVPGGAGHLEKRGERRENTQGNKSHAAAPTTGWATPKFPHRHASSGSHKDLSQKP